MAKENGLLAQGGGEKITFTKMEGRRENEVMV